jgi:hypothetical protein
VRRSLDDVTQLKEHAMSISRVNIQTSNFSLNAVNIRGPQLGRLLDQLRRIGGSSSGGPTATAPSTGPGAMQSPAERFKRVAEQMGAGGAQPDPQTNGFAGGGSSSLASLDPGGLVGLLMQLLQRLLESLFGMLGGNGNNAGGGGGGGCGQGGGSSAGPANGPNGAGGAGASSPAPTGGADTGTLPGPTLSTPAPTPTKPPTTGCGNGGSAPVPPRASSCGASSRSRARPTRRPSLAKRILASIGKGAATAAPLALPGVGGACAAAASASRLGGGSLEDRIFQFLQSKLRDAEGELEGAMQQSDSAGGSGGDSRSAATQKVQQLIQKRSEMVELLTNTMKTMHDSSMAVNRNIRS